MLQQKARMLTTMDACLWMLCQSVDVVGKLRKPKIPCRFDTDVNAPALAEFLYDNPDKTTSLAYITVGTGVGVGLVVNGQTVNGTTSLEIAPTFLPRTDHACLFRVLPGLLHPEGGHVRVARAPGDAFAGTCPFHGDCVEGLASTGALAKRKGCTPSDLPSLSDDDELWVHAADAIAQLCANLVLTVSPERIVLGGGVMQRTCLYDMVRVSAPLPQRGGLRILRLISFSAPRRWHTQNRIAPKRS